MKSKVERVLITFLNNEKLSVKHFLSCIYIPLSLFAANRGTDQQPIQQQQQQEGWRIGNVQSLSVDEESPFLGGLMPGQAQLAVDAGSMFRAPAFPHSASPGDFLLIRTRRAPR